MIFYNPQLMKDEYQLTLFIVSDPHGVDNVADHEAAIYYQILEMVDKVIEKGIDPIPLIENYLNRPYHSGDTNVEMVDFIINSSQMYSALDILHENWNNMDESKPENSIRFLSKTTREQAIEAFSELNLESYLEALAESFEG